MTTLRQSTTTESRMKQAVRPSLGRLTAKLLLASALGAVAALSLAPQPAQAQFVCVGNTDGDIVPTNATASGDGADAAGNTLNFACGTNANASGSSSSANTAIGVDADASVGAGS